MMRWTPLRKERAVIDAREIDRADWPAYCASIGIELHELEAWDAAYTTKGPEGLRIATPTRYSASVKWAVLAGCKSGKLTAGEVAQQMARPWSEVSWAVSHLRIAGYIERARGEQPNRRVSKSRYVLTPEGEAALLSMRRMRRSPLGSTPAA